MTQVDLAVAANSSTRHLSCLETGRSQPSREMVMHLAEHLEVPLREQNNLLLAAGFAPAFLERSLAELASARLAIDRILHAHKPYPAFAIDRHWNVVVSNGALPQLYEGCSSELLRQPVNAVRLILHPLGMGPRIVNYAEWRAHTVAVLRQQLEARPDPVIQALLTEVTRLGTVSFLNTNTIFGTPTDVTLSELALEMLFPADEHTVAIVRLMVDEQAAGLLVQRV
jgi:transcriptional regulator with XRE-family HTH domain